MTNALDSYFYFRATGDSIFHPRFSNTWGQKAFDLFINALIGVSPDILKPLREVIITPNMGGTFTLTNNMAVEAAKTQVEYTLLKMSNEEFRYFLNTSKVADTIFKKSKKHIKVCADYARVLPVPEEVPGGSAAEEILKWGKNRETLVYRCFVQGGVRVGEKDRCPFPYLVRTTSVDHYVAVEYRPLADLPNSIPSLIEPRPLIEPRLGANRRSRVAKAAKDGKLLIPVIPLAGVIISLTECLNSGATYLPHLALSSLIFNSEPLPNLHRAAVHYLNA